MFGMSASAYSGNTLFSLPFTPSAFGPSEGPTPTRNPDYIDGATIVYAAASLGIVHNLATNKQLFFDAHDDDVTCITVSNDGLYAATGQMGKTPRVYIWSTNIPRSQAKKPLNVIIDHEFFQRGVCALIFSFDNAYIVCIGCDDKHTLGIFDTNTSEKICHCPSQAGIPPQIKWINYCASQQFTEYINREQTGLCDLFVTAGVNHIRLWSFRRPTTHTTKAGSSSSSSPSDAVLHCKNCTIGKAGVAAAAKTYLCAAFLSCDDKTYDLVAGGSNGAVYLWRKGKLITTSQVLRGKVSSLVTGGDSRVYCGGGGGVVKILDGRTLNTIQQFNLIAVDPLKAMSGGNLSAARGASRQSSSSMMGLRNAAPLDRPRTASATPSSRLAHRSQGIKIRPALEEPKHAAGMIRSQDDSAVAAITGTGMRGSTNKDAASESDTDDGSGSKLVTGITLIVSGNRNFGPNQGLYILATLGTGKLVRIDCSSSSGGVGGSSSSSTGNTPRPGSASGKASIVEAMGKELLHFHTGPVYGLAADVTQENRLLATVCDDRRLMVWDAHDCVLIAKTATQVSYLWIDCFIH